MRWKLVTTVLVWSCNSAPNTTKGPHLQVNPNVKANVIDDSDADTDTDSDADTDTDSDADTDSDTDTHADNDADPHTQGSSGCGILTPSIEPALTIQGQPRNFVLDLPQNYNPSNPYPLVFALHGLGGSGEIAKSYFGLESTAGSEAIIVYPSALPLADFDGDTGWNLNPYGYDFSFFDALYTHLTEELCVNTHRVFATGHSFGGYMSNALGCYRSNVLRAIAPVNGGPAFWWGNCSGSMAATIIHGTYDNVVYLSEGEATLSRWSTRNACTATTTETGISSCVAYEGCDRDVQWCEFAGGHEWPYFASAAIWSFFSGQ